MSNQDWEELRARYGSSAEAARVLGIPVTTFKSRLERQRSWRQDWQGDDPAFEYPNDIPDAEPSYEELKEQVIRDFNRLAANREATKLLRVKVKIEGPYGVMVKGDAHLDNPGTDWPLLNKHLQILKNTEGLFGANVGDISDNWVGRLARLYANSNISRARAIILIEGYLREVPWLWIDPGNHDLWSGADDPVRWITRFAGIQYKWQGSRIELVPPSGRKITVNSRHDHPGYSQFHSTHGPLKAAIQDGFADTIYTCGHIHSGGYMIYPHNNGKICHIFRASSYKVYDQHKDERGFRDHHLPAGIFVIDPHASSEMASVIFYGDPEEGAEVLTWKRNRFKSSKRAA